MPTIGIRELKAQASDVVRQVKEQHAEYVVTVRGEPAALLLPIDPASLSLRPADKLPAPAAPDRTAQLARAAQLAGQFHAATPDLAEAHDLYLAEAFTA